MRTVRCFTAVSTVLATVHAAVTSLRRDNDIVHTTTDLVSDDYQGIDQYFLKYLCIASSDTSDENHTQRNMRTLPNLTVPNETFKPLGALRSSVDHSTSNDVAKLKTVKQEVKSKIKPISKHSYQHHNEAQAIYAAARRVAFVLGYTANDVLETLNTIDFASSATTDEVSSDCGMILAISKAVKDGKVHILDKMTHNSTITTMYLLISSSKSQTLPNTTMLQSVFVVLAIILANGDNAFDIERRVQQLLIIMNFNSESQQFVSLAVSAAMNLPHDFRLRYVAALLVVHLCWPKSLNESASLNDVLRLKIFQSKHNSLSLTLTNLEDGTLSMTKSVSSTGHGKPRLYFNKTHTQNETSTYIQEQYLNAPYFGDWHFTPDSLSLHEVAMAIARDSLISNHLTIHDHDGQLLSIVKNLSAAQCTSGINDASREALYLRDIMDAELHNNRRGIPNHLISSRLQEARMARIFDSARQSIQRPSNTRPNDVTYCGEPSGAFFATVLRIQQSLVPGVPDPTHDDCSKAWDWAKFYMAMVPDVDRGVVSMESNCIYRCFTSAYYQNSVGYRIGQLAAEADIHPVFAAYVIQELARFMKMTAEQLLQLSRVQVSSLLRLFVDADVQSMPVLDVSLFILGDGSVSLIHAIRFGALRIIAGALANATLPAMLEHVYGQPSMSPNSRIPTHIRNVLYSLGRVGLALESYPNNLTVLLSIDPILEGSSVLCSMQYNQREVEFSKAIMYTSLISARFKDPVVALELRKIVFAHSTKSALALPAAPNILRILSKLYALSACASGDIEEGGKLTDVNVHFHFAAEILGNVRSVRIDDAVRRMERLGHPRKFIDAFCNCWKSEIGCSNAASHSKLAQIHRSAVQLIHFSQDAKVFLV